MEQRAFLVQDTLKRPKAIEMRRAHIGDYPERRLKDRSHPTHFTHLTRSHLYDECLCVQRRIQHG